MRHALYKLTLIVGLIAFGISACNQPTTNINENEQKTEELILGSNSIDNQYIVVFKETNAKGKVISPQKVRSELFSEYGIESASVVNKYNVALKGFTAKLDEAKLAKLKKDDRIAYIEKDQIVTLAPPCGTPVNPCDGGGGDDGGNSGEVIPWGVQRVGGPTPSNGTAWIIDTGIDLDHPDLNVDVGRSAEFVSSGPGAKTVDDGNGHGTHVAGTIAAIDNDIDVVGIAAGATVVAVKVLNDRGTGSYSGVIAGIDYVAANASPGDVANMSLGGPTSQALDDAVRNAADQGIYFAIAAGNDAANANNYSPARVEYNNVWTVSATNENDVFASFSNFSGPTKPPIEFAAPGVSILSLWEDGGTNTISGTSMASPHVAGVLLVTGGHPGIDGFATNDLDGDPDPIVHN
ncbi:MAG TPA: S8 family serine peptidase [Balneolaceae bacterium]|nr:S8 family serine peptidase [Balneolaceae bacterium]